MVKLSGLKDKRTVGSAPNAGVSLICFICGASNANWPIYSRSRSSDKMPFFPFLDYHEPPEEARPIDKTNGRVDSCTVCFSFLTQQWHAFEASDTPIVKRIYWLKRSGSETSGEGTQSPHGEKQIKAEEILANATRLEETVGDSGTSTINDEEFEQNSVKGTITNDAVLPASTVNTSPDSSMGSSVEDSLASECARRSCLETCYICSRRKPKEFMRSVHTRPQLKTETPFYPCLARHAPPTSAKKMDYLGKVVVCEACQKFLFRQWQVFQKNSTPLSERQYQLRSDPSLPREQQSELSTMVCFICGVTQPATSGRFLYSRKHAPGHPYYPFLNNLSTPLGAMPLTKHGLTRACSGCRKSLHRQWKHFVNSGIREDKREYRIRNEVMVPSVSFAKEAVPEIACYTCGQQCSEPDLRPVHTKPNTNPLKQNFFFPFIGALKPPAGCRNLDNVGRTFVCKSCHTLLTEEWEEFERNNIIQNERSYRLMLLAAPKEPEVTSVCFLCGVTTQFSTHCKLYSFPHSGKGVRDGGPFFPFLSSRDPAVNAQPIDGEGTTVACEICYSNLMVQWNVYETSDIPEESNRWLRKYDVTCIKCYLCCKQVPRGLCGAVNKQLITFPPHHHPPRTGIVVNSGRDVILCDPCRRKVQKDLEAMDDCNLRKGVVHLQRSEKEVQNAAEEKDPVDINKEDQNSKQSICKEDPVIIIDSSEDSEEGEYVTSQLRNKKARLGSCSGQSSNASPMHYTTSLSPGLQPPLSSKDSVPVSADSSMSGGQASFAAALRKLAKQAKPIVPSLASSPASSNSSSQSASPSISAASAKSTGMSPSRTSPSATRTEMSTKDRGEQPSPIGISILTPPITAGPVLDPDHRNHRSGEATSDSSRGPLRPEVSHSRIGHQVMPGVYSSGPRGRSEVTMLSEQYPPEPPRAPVAFYAYGAKPDIPIFVPRGPHPPGPPPLLASKRDGPEAHILPAFYPSPYPPAVMDPHDAHFNTWRQQRAVEHLRQQHERHAVMADGTVVLETYDRPITHIADSPLHLPPTRIDPFARRDSPHLRTGDVSEPQETRKQEASESSKKDGESENVPGDPKRGPAEGNVQRGFYAEPNKGSCPVHGHGTSSGTPMSSSGEPPRSHGLCASHGLPVRGDPALPSKIARPGEYKRIFLPGPETPVLHPYLVPPSREGPYPMHRVDERHVEFVRERERQEFLFHERLMFEQKEGLPTQGEEWSRLQLQQDKSGGRGIVHYPQPLHQRHLESRKSPLSIDHRKIDSPLGRMAPGCEKDLYRPFPFHHSYPSQLPDGKAFGDRYGNELDLYHIQHESMNRVKPPERLGIHEPTYLDPYPFSREGFQSSIPRVDRASGERQERPLFLNGDYRPDAQRPKSTNQVSPALATMVKEEKVTDELQDKPMIKIKHNPHKLKFLEGLGLVTVGRKKEISQGETLNLKRKYDGTHICDNNTESPCNMEKDKLISSHIYGNDHALSLPSQEKLEFMSKLGLLPPYKRQELEQSYEIKRNERKNRKVRGRPPKRTRREKENDRDSDNSQGSLDPDNITGPITRQKQQLLQEQERKENRNHDMDKEPPGTIKSEEGEKRISPIAYSRGYRRKEEEMCRQSPTSISASNHLPPRLTLQSLTNMEDPFTNISASQFRPPYLRHTGLLSISREHGSVASSIRTEPRPVTQPIRPEPLRSMGISLSEQETREYLSQHSPDIPTEFGQQFRSLSSTKQQLDVNRTKSGVHIILDNRESLSKDRDGYKWPGVESVMNGYFTYVADVSAIRQIAKRGLEIDVLQDNAEMLRSQNYFLNEEAQSLSLQMTGLVQAKKDLLEERRILKEGLDKLHFFIESLKR